MPEALRQTPLCRLLLLLALLPGVGHGAAVESMDLPEPAVQVASQDGVLVMDLSYRVPVPPREAWSVLTDFEHMADFVPNLESSRILQRSGTRLEVEQAGSLRLGVLPIHYESTRQIDTVPYQSIRSHTLSGTARLESVMVLTPAGDGTLLSYHASAVPDLPVPASLLGSYLGELLESQFKAMGREMVRRAQLSGASAGGEPAPPAREAASAAPRQAANGAGPAIRQSGLAPKKTRLPTKKRPG